VVIAEQQQDVGAFGRVSDGGHRHADGQKQTAEAVQQWSRVRHNGGASRESGASGQPLLQVSDWSVWRQTAGRGCLAPLATERGVWRGVGGAAEVFFAAGERVRNTDCRSAGKSSEFVNPVFLLCDEG
jgi:hypothetical protein